MPETFGNSSGSAGNCDDGCDKSPDSTVENGTPCPHCGAPVAPDEGQCSRGHWQPGNVASLKHGAFSRQVSQGLGPDAKADLDTRRAQILADQGGRASLTQLQVDGIEKAVTLHALLNHAGNRLVVDGVFGDRGHPRPALGAYLSLLDRWIRLAQLLGLQRKERNVTDPLDYLQQGGQE